MNKFDVTIYTLIVALSSAGLVYACLSRVLFAIIVCSIALVSQVAISYFIITEREKERKAKHSQICKECQDKIKE